MTKNNSRNYTPRLSTLRVIAGKYKGTKLKSPQSALTHPMGSREKLALFNILHDVVPGAVVLDAYAGSGALGIEALSQGAESVTFVERAPKSTRTIRENLQQLALDSARATVFSEPVRAFAERPAYQAAFDLIIADPPYDALDMDELQLLLQLLHEGGTLALSYPAGQPLPDFVGLELITNRAYAGASITTWRRV